MVRIDYYAGMDLADLAREARRVILGGGIVLAPTETQYGLCCDADVARAVDDLNSCKRRQSAEPMAIFVQSWLHAQGLIAPQPTHVSGFMARFWPGPLTVVLKAGRGAWRGIIGATGKIGLRCSSHAVIGALLSSSDRFLTATSANPHGEAPSSQPSQMINWFGDRVDLYIFDGSLAQGSKPSTVVDCTGSEPEIIREGVISSEMILEAWNSARR